MSENISKEEQKEYIEYMLHNEKIEKSLINWKHNQISETLAKMIEIIATESEECAGLILSETAIIFQQERIISYYLQVQREEISIGW